jgi:hypothetical protein
LRGGRQLCSQKGVVFTVVQVASFAVVAVRYEIYSFSSDMIGAEIKYTPQGEIENVRLFTQSN